MTRPILQFMLSNRIANQAIARYLLLRHHDLLTPKLRHFTGMRDMISSSGRRLSCTLSASDAI